MLSGPDGPTARWLTSVAGLAAVTAVTRRLDEGATTLAVAEQLRGAVADPARRAAVVDAALARRRARARWPDAESLLFTGEALEQASDPAVSAHRAARLVVALTADGGRGGGGAGRLVDLGCGVGGDTLALARAAPPGVEVHAVDRDPGRLALLAHNAEVAGVEVTIRCADLRELTLSPHDVLHADPGRREGGRRLRHLSEYQPPVDALLAAHGHAAAGAVALAPGVDIDDAALPEDVEVEYVQLGDALVEATLWWGAAAADGPAVRRTRASLLPAPTGPGPSTSPILTSHLGVPSEREWLPVAEVGALLIDPAAAVVRARLHDDLGRSIGAWRTARHRAVLSADRTPPTSPWLRARRVLAVLPGRPRAVRAWLRSAEAAAAWRELAGQHDAAAATTTPTVEVVLHGVDADPVAVWRELGRPPRGPRGIRVELLRRDTDTITVVTVADQVSHPTATMGVWMT